MLFLSCSLLLSVSCSYEDAAKATPVYRRGDASYTCLPAGAMQASPPPLSPTENLFDIGKSLTEGKWRNTGVSFDEKTVNNWPIGPRCGCESGNEDRDWPS